MNELRRELENVKIFTVIVANRQTMQCDFICKGFQWEMQKEMFEKDFWLLMLGGVTWSLAWTGLISLYQFNFTPSLLQFHFTRRAEKLH